VNGEWVKFKNLDTIGIKKPFAGAPYVQPSPTPLVVQQNYKFEEYVPPDGSIHIKATGHSLNCLSTLFGDDLSAGLRTYGLSVGGACLAAGTHGVGAVEVTHTGPDFGTAAPGQPTTFSVTSSGGEGGTCSTTTTQLCLTNSECPPSETCTVTGGSFTLTYTVKVIP